MTDLICETISSIKTQNKKLWNDFIKRSALTSLFYRYEYLLSVEEGMQYEPRHIIVRKDNNIVGVFPHFIQTFPSLPFKVLYSMDPGYGGPLIGKHEPQVFSLMMNEIPKICTKTILAHYIKAKRSGFIRYHHQLINLGYRLNVRYSQLSLPLKNRTYEEIKKNYSSDKKTELNKMKRLHIEIIDKPITDQVLTTFHESYKQTMKRVEGISLPLEFLHNLRKHMGDDMKLITVALDGRNIGSHIYLLNKEQNMLMAWLLDINKDNHKFHPSTVLHDHMIQWGLEHKFDSYDFGYNLADFRDGLFKYKEDYGTMASPLLLWEKRYGVIPLKLVRMGGNIYKRFIKPKHIRQM